MTPDRLRECLDALRWGASTLAAATGAHRNSVNDWLTGRVRIRPELAAWIEQLAAYHQRNPPPPRPDRGAREAADMARASRSP